MTGVETTFQIIDHEPIKLSDGCILSARIWRPETSEALPAILEIHPYPKRYSTAMRDEVNHGWFASNGYVSLRVDTPGAGDSEGRLTDEYRPEEHDSILQVLAWIVAQDWCDGNIGMFGHSWGAYSGLRMAALNPPCLKAVVASGVSDDLYAEDCHFRGGVMASEHMGWASTMLSFFSRPPDPEIVGDKWKELWLDHLGNTEWLLPHWLDHPTRDDHWKYPSVCENYDAVKIPVLTASGWADTYSNSIMRMAANMPASFKGVIGPWAHKFPHMGMPKPAIGWLQECVNWWDRWLKGVENGVEDLPRLRLFIPENIKPETTSDSDREGRWVSEPQWPSPSTAMVEYKLGDGTLCHYQSEHELVICSPQSLGTAAGEIMPMGWGADLPGDQRSDDGQSLVFDTAVLDEPLVALGNAVVELSITSDKPVAFIVGRLCDVAPDGASTRICYGALNLTHTENHEKVRYLEPGKIYRVRLELDATAYRFNSGHRIRLALSNAYWPLLWPSPEAVKLKVSTADSTLFLPIRPERDEVTPAFDPPASAPHLARTILEKARSERTVTHDLATGETTYRVMDWGAKERSDTSGLITSGTTERVYTIHDDDPSSCTMLSMRHLAVGRDDMKLSTYAEAYMSCTRDNFYLTAQLKAWEGDDEIFNRSWENDAPRNGN